MGRGDTRKENQLYIFEAMRWQLSLLFYKTISVLVFSVKWLWVCVPKCHLLLINEEQQLIREKKKVSGNKGMLSVHDGLYDLKRKMLVQSKLLPKPELFTKIHNQRQTLISKQFITGRPHLYFMYTLSAQLCKKHF